MKQKMPLFGAIFLCIFLLLSPSAYAIGTIFAYGDSLTDNGFNTTDDPLGLARFTDGALWVETLATSMGSNLIDVAFGGATTGNDNPAALAAGVPEGEYALGLQWQLAATVPYFSSMGLDMDDTLFTVWAGANDFFQDRVSTDAAANIGTALKTLSIAGATSIMVPNLPDLGYTPAFYDYPELVTSTFATNWTSEFNDALEATLSDFTDFNPDINLYYLDVFTVFDNAIKTNKNGKIIKKCQWEALFWDDVHPTSIGHQMIAAAAYDTLQAAPVPEPSTIVLMGLGLVGLAGLGRKKFRK